MDFGPRLLIQDSPNTKLLSHWNIRRFDLRTGSVIAGFSSLYAVIRRELKKAKFKYVPREHTLTSLCRT
jgi:hypothetical protein